MGKFSTIIGRVGEVIMAIHSALSNTSVEAQPAGSPDYWVLRKRLLPASGQQTLAAQVAAGGLVDAPMQPSPPESFIFDARPAESLATFVAPYLQASSKTDVTSPVDVQQAWAFPIESAAIDFDLGSKIPVTVSPEAKGLLAQAPWPGLQALLGSLRRWALTTQELRAANIRVLSDPEDATWVELVTELRIETVSDELALSLWDRIGAEIDAAKSALKPQDRQWFDNHFAVHLFWGSADISHDDTNSI